MTKENKGFKNITLKNDNGIEVEILTLGGIIKSIKTPDKNGEYENILLEFKEEETYLENPGYMNAIIGRTAGRVNKGQVTLGKTLYNLTQNEDGHNLHGGKLGLGRKIWKSKDISTSEADAVELSIQSNHLEEGYPGKLSVKVKYILTNDNELHIKYSALTDKDTIINLTNHGYFNLSGNAKRDILGHKLQINSDKICELTSEGISTGKILDLKLEENSEFDFRTYKRIGKDIKNPHKQLEAVGGYDHPWILDNQGQVAKMYDEQSGRTLEVVSDQNVVVVYTMNGHTDAEFTNGAKNIKNYGITFESQNYPIGIDECFKEDNIIKAGETYVQNTVWKFGTK